MRCLLVYAFALWGLASASFAQQITQHPVIAQLTSDGVAVGGGESLTLGPPVVTPDMSADAQRQSLTRLVGSRQLDRFMRDSVVAPFELDIQTVRDANNRAKVRRLDLAFAAHASLQLIHERELLSKVFGGEDASRRMQQSGFETYGEPVDKQATPTAGAPPQGRLIPSLYRYRFPLLEKVVVSGLVAGQGLSIDGALQQSAVTPADKVDDPANPSVWQAIPRGVETDSGLEPPETFPGIACYLQATQLKFAKDVVLVECHAAYVEPYGWFDGRNLLASKLPLLMQKSVRDFRRKLKEVQAEVGD